MSAAAGEHHVLEARLDYRFTDQSLLSQALTHRSLTGGRRGAGGATNERLEFLGDRVLGLVIADALLAKFTAENEGELAQRLAALVSENVLADVARDLGLGDHVRAAPGQDAGETDAIMADACEAVIGAMYRDGGLRAAEEFIHAHWVKRIDAAVAPPKDPKSALQEWAQGKGLPLPTYRVIDRTGPDHAPQFTVGVTVEGHAEQIGQGRTKRQAETTAAQALIDREA
ncbi:MAG: ribonuclease III [Rhodobacteraceae bacterium]|nr:ribonuclease III [Paracoccaceae bacterium]